MAYYGLYSSKPARWSNRYRDNQRSRAPRLRTPDKGCFQLHVQIQHHTARLVRNLRRSYLRHHARERTQKVEAELEGSADRGSEPAVARFVRVHLQLISFRGGPPGPNPESRDSGFALRAPRNDG